MRACPDCGSVWATGAPPSCAIAGHRARHLSFEMHIHRTLVRLPDGTEVTAASFDADSPYERASPPDYGLYLDRRWEPPWPHEHLDWPDFGVPGDTDGLVGTLLTVLDRARSGDQVEIGCLGGHGRTGTALTCVAVLAGIAPADAVAWVRANYCDHAVETADQAAFVAGLKTT